MLFEVVTEGSGGGPLFLFLAILKGVIKRCVAEQYGDEERKGGRGHSVWRGFGRAESALMQTL